MPAPTAAAHGMAAACSPTMKPHNCANGLSCSALPRSMTTSWSRKLTAPRPTPPPLSLRRGCGPSGRMTAQPGGGILLLVRETFLRRFRAVHQQDWAEVVPGRFATLTLRGPSGDLSIGTVYMPTGHHRDDRRPIMYAIRAWATRNSSALLSLAGDFNFACNLAACRHFVFVSRQCHPLLAQCIQLPLGHNVGG